MTRVGDRGRNGRGNSVDRRKRKRFLLDTFGDGVTVKCALRLSPKCPGVLTYDTLTVDRIKPGARGGRYTRDNIQPACEPCNTLSGALLGAAIKRGKARRKAKRDADAQQARLRAT